MVKLPFVTTASLASVVVAAVVGLASAAAAAATAAVLVVSVDAKDDSTMNPDYLVYVSPENHDPPAQSCVVIAVDETAAARLLNPVDASCSSPLVHWLSSPYELLVLLWLCL